MRTLIASGLVLAGTGLVVAAALLAPQPAGACSYDCLFDAQTLSSPQVTLLDGDESATPPDLGEEGMMSVAADGTPLSVNLDGTWIEIDAGEGE